jgi:hypothetical protein
LLRFSPDQRHNRLLPCDARALARFLYHAFAVFGLRACVRACCFSEAFFFCTKQALHFPLFSPYCLLMDIAL